MKSFIAILLCTLSLSFAAFSQKAGNTITKPTLGPYYWTVKVPMTEVDINGIATDSLPVEKLSKPNQYFEIIKIIDKDNIAIIIISDYVDTNSSNYYNFKTEPENDVSLQKMWKQLNEEKVIRVEDDGWGSKKPVISKKPVKDANVDSGLEKNKFSDTLNSAKSAGIPMFNRNEVIGNSDYKQLRYFKVPLDLIESYAVKNTFNPMAFEFGLINFPFKYRFSKMYSNFSGSFNFGAALGLKVKRKSYRNTSISIISGYSVSSTTLEASEVRRNSSDLAETNNFTAISFSVGPMIENNRVQIGLFGGLDFLGRLNQSQYGWRHQGKPWFSIGFGYTIFSKQEEKASEDKNP